jgi:hypothetical protein
VTGQGAEKPAPDPDRFERRELQQAYEDGFDQEYDYDSFVLLDRFAWMLDGVSAPLGAERRAAMLDGAADALRALARVRRDELPLLRALAGAPDDRPEGNRVHGEIDR